MIAEQDNPSTPLAVVPFYPDSINRATIKLLEEVEAASIVPVLETCAVAEGGEAASALARYLSFQ